MKSFLPRILLFISIFGLVLGVGIAAKHAVFLPSLGSALNLIFQPRDLYAPLATTHLRKGVVAYKLTVRHKYPGYHVIEISIPTQKSMEPVLQNLTVHIEFEQNEKHLLERSGNGYAFWGKGRQGAGFCVYDFPKDINSSGEVTCRVLIEGDFGSAIDQYGDVELAIIKASDK